MSITTPSSAEKNKQATDQNNVEIFNKPLKEYIIENDWQKHILEEEKKLQIFNQRAEAKKLTYEFLSDSPNTNIVYDTYTFDHKDINSILSKFSKIESLKNDTNVNREEAKHSKNELLAKGMNVGFYENNNSYVISQIDSTNKHSCGYQNCTAIILFGIDKNSGKRLSLLSHQNPGCFLKDSVSLLKAIDEKMQVFKASCKEGSISAFIGGGNIGNDEKNKTYNDSIRLLEPQIIKSLDINPQILYPNKNKGDVTISINTQENKITVLQPE